MLIQPKILDIIDDKPNSIDFTVCILAIDFIILFFVEKKEFFYIL
jgi:hypothetical protein